MRHQIAQADAAQDTPLAGYKAQVCSEDPDLLIVETNLHMTYGTGLLVVAAGGHGEENYLTYRWVTARSLIPPCSHVLAPTIPP